MRRMLTKRHIKRNQKKFWRSCAYHPGVEATTGVTQNGEIIMYLCDPCVTKLRKK